MPEIANLLTSEPIFSLIKVAAIVLVTFLAVRLFSRSYNRWVKQAIEPTGDRERKTAAKTRSDIIRRIIIFSIYFLGIIAILFQFEAVRNLGVGLFASASVAGIVLGMAAQNTLSNMIAGITISFSQPIRLGDAVIMDEEFGFVEEITLMQTFIRTWDNRRIIVPNDVLSNKIIQNWSIRDPQLLAPIILYLDYSCDIKKVREWIIQAIKESNFWNKGADPAVQIIDFTEKSMKVPALAWANDAPSAWNLRCEVREKLIKYFKEEGLRFPTFLSFLSEIFDILIRFELIGASLTENKGRVRSRLTRSLSCEHP